MVAAAIQTSSPELQPPTAPTKGADSSMDGSPKAVHELLVPRMMAPKTTMQVARLVPETVEPPPFDGTSLRPFDPQAPFANFSPGALLPARGSRATHARSPEHRTPC